MTVFTAGMVNAAGMGNDGMVAGMVNAAGMVNDGMVEAHMASIWESMMSLVTGQAADWVGTFLSILYTLQSVFIGAMKRQYLQNDYFAGGVGLMLIGLVARSLKSHGGKIWTFLTQSRGLVRVHIKPEEAAFQWVSEWICSHAAKDSDQLELQLKYGNDEDKDNLENWDGSGTPPHRPLERPRILYMPKLQEAQNVTYRGEKVTFQVQRSIGAANQGESSDGDLAAILKAAGGKEALSITARNRSTIEALILEAMEDAMKEEEGTRKTCVKRWLANEYYWAVMANKLARPLESVVLDVQAERLVDDARQFLASQRWYSERGIPHRRGYLLWGPPGTGKTSTILALAGELNLDVAMIGLSSKDMNDEMLMTALTRLDTRSILVLEDIDAAFSGGNDRIDGDDKMNRLSFSGLLNAIDGISAQEGRLLVMTTNHLDRLDAALIRPGRVDLRLHLDLASEQQITRLFKRFFPEAADGLAEEFASKLPEGVLSPASIQGYFLLHRDDAQSAMDNVADLLASHEEEKQRCEKKKEQERQRLDRLSHAPSNPATPVLSEDGFVTKRVEPFDEECSTVRSENLVEEAAKSGALKKAGGGPIKKLAMALALAAVASSLGAKNSLLK